MVITVAIGTATGILLAVGTVYVCIRWGHDGIKILSRYRLSFVAGGGMLVVAGLAFSEMERRQLSAEDFRREAAAKEWLLNLPNDARRAECERILAVPPDIYTKRIPKSSDDPLYDALKKIYADRDRERNECSQFLAAPPARRGMVVVPEAPSIGLRAFTPYVVAVFATALTDPLRWALMLVAAGLAISTSLPIWSAAVAAVGFAAFHLATIYTWWEMIGIADQWPRRAIVILLANLVLAYATVGGVRLGRWLFRHRWPQ